MSDNHKLTVNENNSQTTNSTTVSSTSTSQSSVIESINGEQDIINHSDIFNDKTALLYLNEEYSDVTLIVDKVKIAGHKVILASRSDYFRALLFGGLKESRENTIELSVTSLLSFKLLLKYIYTGKLCLNNLKEDNIFDILAMAHQYGFESLEVSISKYLEGKLNVKNVCQIYDSAVFYSMHSLANVCSSFIDVHAAEIITSEAFLSLSPYSLKTMISRDSFCAPEVSIVVAIAEWKKRNSIKDIGDILDCVRLSLININDLLNVVRPLELVSADTLLDAIKAKNDSRDTDLKHRGCLLPDENVATEQQGAQVLVGEMRGSLLTGNYTYDMERGFSSHHIDKHHPQGILLKLGKQTIINHIRILLWDKDMRSYSYCIEVSVDKIDWIRVIDHTNYLCRSWQNLYFPARVVKYIRVIGTHNTVNRVFHIVSFECMYTTKPFHLINSLLAPNFNVASARHNANVIEGVSRSRNALIDGDWKNYDWDTGYTCHQLGSGAIVVQLAQPFIINSMRLLLWDIDSRTYSYYIEVSTDQQNWKIVADKRHKAYRSWQDISFSALPVVFVRIVGTYNTANEVFHCVHFECCYNESSNQNISDEDRNSNLTTASTNSLPVSSMKDLTINETSANNEQSKADELNQDDADLSNQAEELIGQQNQQQLQEQRQELDYDTDDDGLLSLANKK